MPTNGMSEKIQDLLAEALRVPRSDVNPDLALGDLPQWDSMGHMEVMMYLENRFGVEINNDTIANLTSVPAICEYLDSNHLAG